MATNPETSVTDPVQEEPKKKSRRGFAAMSPEKQKEIAAKGGRAAHVKGTAHEFTRVTAVTAGRKGGLSKQRNRPVEGEDQDLPTE